MSPVSILLFCEFPTLNGGEQSLLSALDVLGQEDSFRFSAVVPDPGDLAEALRKRGVIVHPLAIRRQDGSRDAPAVVRQRFVEIIRRVKPDLVHANSLSMSRLLGPVARQLVVPSLGHLRDIIGLSGQAVADVNSNTRLLAVSDATRDWHVAAGVQAEKTFVVHNGVNLAQFAPRPATGYLHRELNLPANSRLLAAIGQIGLRKAWDQVLSIVAPILTTTNDLHLLLVGRRFSTKRESVDYEKQLRSVARQNSLRDRIHFLGWRRDIPELLNEILLLIHAARQEPLGRVLLEAAASGVPVLASDVGGTKEIFPDEQCGARLFSLDRREQMHHSLQELLGSDTLLAVMSRQARRRAKEAFDDQRAANELGRHYREVAALHHSESRSG